VRPVAGSQIAPLGVACWFALGCSCSDDAQATPANSSGGGRPDTAGGSGSGGAPADAAVDAALTCPPEPRPTEVPAGWIKFPGLPCACDVWIAPDESLMGPAPGWIETPPGVLEMEVNWAGYENRLSNAVGDSFEGVQHLKFRRRMGNKTLEVVIVRFPDQRVVFRAALPRGLSGKCDVYLDALRQGVGLWEAWQVVEGLAATAYVFAAGPVAPVPRVIHAGVDTLTAQRWAVGKRVVGIVYAPDTRLDAFELDPVRKHLEAWTSSQGEYVQQTGFDAWDDHLFFHLTADWRKPEIWSWDPAGGAKPFVKTTGEAPGKIGATCGLGTDGKWLVWLQASGWDGSAWESVEMVKAPYTTDPAKLAPVRVRSLPGGLGGCRSLRVGDGYASTQALVSKSLDPEGNVFVVRLSDGQMWRVPTREGRYWGVPLWVDSKEVVVPEGLTLPNDAGIPGVQLWSIVRYPLSLLGPGDPP
jgi:hypothetical protein